MIRTKGEAGTGNVVEAVRHMRALQQTLLSDDCYLPWVMQDQGPLAAGMRIVTSQGTGAAFRCPRTRLGAPRAASSAGAS